MSIEEIYQSMKGDVETASGTYINSGGDMALRLYAVAAELYSLSAQGQWLWRQGFPQSATGDSLDSHAELRGLSRRAGTKASGNIRFELAQVRENDIQIPVGTVCVNPAGLEFLTLSEAVIAAGDTRCDVSAQARDLGAAGNVPADSIYQMTLAPVGVSRCYNPSAFSGGTDTESDEMLRSRVLDNFARLPNGSNTAYYEAEAMNTDGVAAVKVLPRARGIGTVDVVIASAEGVPEDGLVLALQEKFEKEREICVDVEVLAPEAVTVDISVDIEVEDGFAAEKVKSDVSAALQAMFSGGLLAKNLYLAKIGSVVFSVSGVRNYAINVPGSDVLISSKELPVKGGISVTGS